jgi:two-component system response regulator PilR (NtrC family)
MDTRIAGHVLVVDDEESMREFLAICLGRAGHRVDVAHDGQAALEWLEQHPGQIDVVLTDLSMPRLDGLGLLERIQGLPDAPLTIMMTAFSTTDSAVRAMKMGAHDYVLKPFDVDEIQLVVARALERRALTHENLRLRDALRGVERMDLMHARSPSMKRVFELVRKIADTKTSVLIRGESGTGKELVARALHRLSDRKDRAFVAVNCGAIPESLMESELFGHVRGAFTGATSDREGVFAAAHGGTLFLDEIGELSPAMQVKLLRVLQERRIRPVGGSQEREVDCRVVAATNRDLEAAIAANEFRQDLYFRLNVVAIVLPPLRHRKEDVPVLAQRFFERFNADMGSRLRGISPEAMQLLLAYDYPGNVRELENLIERAVALEGGDFLSAEQLPNPTPASAPTLRPADAGGDAVVFPESGIELERVLEDLERKLIEEALARARGVRKDAAKLLGISFRSMRYRLAKLGIEIGRDSDEP